MTVIAELSSSVGRRDEAPNQALAKKIADKNSRTAIEELVANLGHKARAIQNDCIKVLYEVGERKPSLVAEYVHEFVALLESRNNRLQWGAMTALSTITLEKPGEVFAEIGKITAAADKGSVITRDNGVKILIQLCSLHQYADAAFRLLIKQLQRCPTNQLPMYAERSLPIINSDNQQAFLKALASRAEEVAKESQAKRLQRIIRDCTHSRPPAGMRQSGARTNRRSSA